VFHFSALCLPNLNNFVYGVVAITVWYSKRTQILCFDLVTCFSFVRGHEKTIDARLFLLLAHLAELWGTVKDLRPEI
jgi:hypothetical protein